MKIENTDYASVNQVKVTKVSSDRFVDIVDDVAVEEPLEIHLQHGSTDNRIQKSLSVTMRTPGNDEELGVGFLFTEGIIKSKNQVSEIKVFPGENKVLISLFENEIPNLQKAERNFYTTSSCGVCGKSSIDSIRTVTAFEITNDNLQLNPELLYSLPVILRKEQSIFDSTGGLHASALFDLEGNILILREDIGRHNALDKIIGTAFLNEQLPLNDKILMLSGRASFELIQKAAMAGIKIVAAVGAPSGLAVKLAEEFGITLIGFLKEERFNIYSGKQRINLITN